MPPNADQLLTTQLLELARRERPTGVVAIPAVLTIAWVHWGAVPTSHVAGWTFYMVLMLLARIAIPLFVPHLPDTRQALKRHANLRMVMTMLYGAGWGAMLFLLDTGKLDFLFMFKLASLAAAFGVTLSSLSTLRRIYISFWMPTSLLLLFFTHAYTPFLQLDERISLLLGEAVYIALVLIAAIKSASLTRLAFEQGFELESALAQTRRAEASLNATQERLRLLLDSVTEGIYGIDTDGVCVFVNKSCLQMLGYEKNEDLVGKMIHTLIHHTYPDGRPYPEEDCQAQMATLVEEATHVIDEEFWRADGSSFPAEYFSHPMYQDGELVGAVVSFADITERKRTEEELDTYHNHLEELVKVRTHELEAAKQLADSANIAKSAFLANMSHEMRTPLHQIAGLGQLIKREPLTPKQTDWMDKLGSACNNLTGIIDRILELTNLEAGKLDMTLEPVSTVGLLSDVSSVMRDEAAKKQLQLVTEAPAVPENLFGYKKLLRRALLNYLSNAIRYTKAGSVKIRALIAKVDSDSMLLRFEVEDTGVGIAPEDQQRLFNIFEQVDNSATREHGGAGLGLATTQRIARIMDGEAGCESRLGEGSTFWFTAQLKKNNPGV